MPSVIEEKIGNGPTAPHIPGMQPVGQQQRPQQVNPAQQNSMGQGQAPDLRAPNLINMINNFASFRQLSAAGMEYTRTITANLTDKTQTAFGMFDVQILKQPSNALMICAGVYAMLLIFQETVEPRDPFPAIAAEEAALASAQTIKPELELLNVILVSPEDYGRVQNMINYIRNSFMIAVNKADEQLVNDVLGTSNILVSDNPQDYETELARLDPHGVPMRHDLTLTVYASNQRQRNNVDLDHDMYYGPKNQDRVILGTVGGYVEFARLQPNEYKFYPIVHISDIQSAIPSARLVPMFLSLAMRRWIMERGWLAYYSRYFSADGKSINLGSLIPDENSPTGRFVVDNPNTLNEFCSKVFADPQIALEVNEGRAKICGIERYAGNTQRQIPVVANQVNAFFGQNIIDLNILASQGQQPFTKQDTTFRGVFSYGNSRQDSAFIDFLTEFTKHPSEALRLEPLAFKRYDPSVKFGEQKEIEDSLQSLYMTSLVIFNPQVMQAMSNALRINTTFQGAGNTMFNMADIVKNSTAWGQMQNQSWYGNYSNSGYNPIAYFYNYQR